MFKLRVISGPNRGSTYEVREDECTIGRQDGNTIVLNSSRVSKRHCKLVASNGEFLLEDQGSANGTFVNGAQTRSKSVKAGDKISVGDFVLELLIETKRPPAFPRARGSGSGQMIPFPGNSMAIGIPAAPAGVQAVGPNPMDFGGSATSAPQEKPKNLLERLRFILDAKIMPYFYGLLFKYEWKVVAAIVFGLFILVNVMVSVQPMVDLGTELVVEEARHRARFMAKEIVDRNAALLAKNAEIRADTGSFEREPGVRQVVLVDLENRIIAPAARQGEYFTRGDAARYVVSMRKEFNDGRSTGASRVMDDNSVVAVEPLLVVDPRVGKNKVAALGVVSIDTEAANPAFTRLGTSYADTMTRSAIFALIALFILYRLTLKPFQVLNEDIDRVLRGEMSQVTHEFKIEELDSLWAVINSALTRIPRSGNAAASGMDAGGGFSGGDSDPSVPFREIAMIASFPSVVLDAEGRITYLNHAFEELANARLDDIRGKAVSESFGDGIPEYIDALMRRVAAGEHGASISMDTSNGSFQLHGSAVVSAGVPKAWMFSAIRAGG